jgi:hypothetical protein
MLRVAVSLAVGALLLDAGAARAQFYWGPTGYTVWQRSGFGFALGGRNWAITGFSGGAYGVVSPVWGPACHGPIWWQPPVMIAPIVVVRQPVPLIDQATIASRVPNLKPEPVPDRWPGAEGRVDRQVKRGDLLVINPRGQGVQPVAGVEPAKPVAPPVALDPVTRARLAFTEGWYGRAAEMLSMAITADPASPQAHFLLAQARTARGDYAGAVAAIQEGMKRAPDWPAEKFDPRAIYGPDAAKFDEHLAELLKAAAADPNDPTLSFLLGYHLWFLGEKAEAVMLFRRAAKQVKDGAVIERFLVEADVKS